MPFEIAPLLPDDIAEFADLDAAAMNGWAVAQAMELEAGRKGQTRRDMVAYWMKIGLANPDPNNVWIKVYDTATGEIIAGANWTRKLEPKTSEPKDEVPAPIKVEGAEPGRDPPSVFSEMLRMGRVSKAKHVGQQPHYHLSVIVTHPKHQRKGAGKMLVEWGCEKADEAGVISTLHSTAAGLKLYLKCGFKIIQEDELDLRPFGVQGVEIRRFMIRQPQTATQS